MYNNLSFITHHLPFIIISMSLANKHRPKWFNEVIGQSHIIDILQAKIAKHENNSHNYIFYGPRGTGKTSTARLFAKAINAQEVDEKGNPLENDPYVEAIDKGTTLDYIEIDAASHTGVDNIREEILAKVPYPPTMLKKKVYVIDEVHMLSAGAFNALLKTIEEPKDYVVFILATTEIHKVPETIISRCQVFNFKKVAEEEMVNHLAHIADKEWLEYEKQALSLIAGISDGCVRDAVKYLDQVSILGKVDVAQASKFLGVASEKLITDFLAAIASKEREQVFTHIDDIQKTGVDLYNFAKQLLQYIDKHLMENIDEYLAISQACSDILATIKYYPYPAIVYKIAFNKLLTGEQTPAQNNNTPVILNEAKPCPPADRRNEESRKEQNKEPVQEASTQSTPNTAQENPTPNTKEPNQNTDQNNTTQNPEPKPEPTAEVKPEANPTAENQTTEKQAPETHTQEEQATNDGETDMNTLKNQLIDKIDKQSLKDNLAENIAIKSIEENTVHMITISTMANLLLQKQETVQYLEKILSNIVKRPVSIKTQYIKKEDYLQSML